MKCPHCGYDKIQPNYKFCPKCRASLTASAPSKAANKDFTPGAATSKGIDSKKFHLSDTEDGPEIRVRHAQDDGSGNTQNAFGNMERTISEQVNPRVGNEFETSSLEFAKNKAIWKIEKGEIARYISPREIDNLDNLDGVIIQDGVTAIIEVDGVEVTELHGGVYNFATVKTVEEAHKKIAEEKEEEKQNLGIFGRIKRTVGRFLFGTKKEELEADRVKNEKRYREVVRRITDKSVISIYLKADRAFPLVFGIVKENDGIRFEPYDIKTRHLDVKVGVSMQLQIGDFHEFITNHMTGNQSVKVSDIGLSFNPFLRSLLQNSLRATEIDGNDLTDAQRTELIEKIKRLDMVPGISIVNVMEVTMDNAILDRFRAVESELYCSERELDYLRRTNEFKNRLAGVQNEQAIITARTELDHRKILDDINKDGLIHEDEMEAFVALLNSQKRIREARTDVEEEKAILELMGNRLVNEDDYAALEDSVKNKEFERSQISEVLRIKSLANTQRIRQQTETELAVQDVRDKIELDRAQIERDRVRSEYLDEKEISAAEKEKTILGKKLEAQEMVDDYAAKVADRDYERDKRKTTDDYDLDKKKKLDEVEILRQKAALARENMEAMKAQERMDKEMDYAHEDKAGERDLEKERIRASMSAEQMAANNLSELDAAAQVEYMKARGSEKENELLKQSSSDKEALLREMMKMQQEASDKSSATQLELVKQMMEFAQKSNATTASVVSDIASSKAQSEKGLRESMERVATARIGEVSDMKKEYQDELHKEQKRTDATQDKALNYTTKVTLADAKTGGKSTAAETPRTYDIEELGVRNVSFDKMATYIKMEALSPTMNVTVDGETKAAMEIDELYPLLLKYFSVKCPECGTKGLAGTVCPECGTEL